MATSWRQAKNKIFSFFPAILFSATRQGVDFDFTMLWPLIETFQGLCCELQREER